MSRNVYVSKKDSKIEIYRFLACCFIMMGHCIAFGNMNISVPFTVSYQFVEFFFILTGYFTAKHFAKSSFKETTIAHIFKYDIKKFLRFIPYTIPAIICIYFEESIGYWRSGDILGLFLNLKDSVIEMLFLSALRLSGAHLFVMWFLSAMFITLPILICFCLIVNNKWIKIVIGALSCSLYYIIIPDYTVHDFPNQLFRSLFGMMLGSVIFYLSSSVSKDKVHKGIKIFLTIILIVAYFLPICFSYLNYYYRYTYLICFMIWIFIVMSGLTVIGPLYSKVGEFLGAISMPIFIWHQVVIKLFTDFIIIDNETVKLILCFVVTFVISVINMFVVKGFTNWIEKRKEVKNPAN